MINIFNTFFCFCDSAQPWQLGFQDPATPIIVGIYKFHHDLMFILVFVCVFVTYIIFTILAKFNQNSWKTPTSVVHGATIEIIWTLIPAFLLIIIAVPSFSLLYSVDEIINPTITVKIVGNQWYWNQQYSDQENDEKDTIIFDSYLLPESDLELGNLRLLEVDNRVVVPVNTHVRLIITSSDVLHCWTIPSFGVKIDACPGRLNESSLFVERQGTFQGQCSEICGVNHGFMPIAVDVVSLEDQVNWVSIKLEEALFF